MCLACDMEAMWFAVMDARAAAGATAGSDGPDEAVTPHGEAVPQLDDPLLPPPERGRVGEGVAGGTEEAAVIRGESEDPHPNPPPEEGGGGPPRWSERANAARRFACEETPAE
jgi:hypothetical protein